MTNNINTEINMALGVSKELGVNIKKSIIASQDNQEPIWHNSYFHIDIYDCRVYAIFDKNWRNIAKKIIKERHKDDDPEVEMFMALTVRCVGEYEGHHQHDYFMFFDENTSDMCIYHECLHVLMYIMSDYCLHYDVNNQDVIAYLGSYIIEEACKLNHNKRKRK